ncbi:MAG: GxxExxY protein [Gemmatimonadetes bacterium]|nr:GxxExxY protein [Gemmatimonadota bacterium]
MGHSFEATSSQVLGAAIEVHRALGPGFLEKTYAAALRVALEFRGVPYAAECEVALTFAGRSVGSYRLDLIADDRVIVELKAVRRFEELHFAQLRAYLRATGLQVGLLLNFNAPVLAVKRVVRGRE